MPKTPLKLLIIEDSESDAGLVVRALEKAGYATDSQRVYSADTLSAALKRQAWDIVVADFRLPGFNAEQALQMIHAHDPDLPFIIVSGSIGEDTAVAMMRAGAHDYLMKGNLTRLAPAVERELEQAKQRRARRESDRNLRESEERYRQLFDLSPFAISIHQDGKVVLANRAALNLLGAKDAGQILGRSIQEFIPPEYWEASRQRIDTLLRGGEIAQPFRNRYLRIDGSAVIVEVTANLFSFKNRPAIQIIFRDIGDRVASEAALRSSEERFSKIFQASPIGIVISQLPEGRIVDLNPALEAILGYPRQECIGRTTMDLDLWVDKEQQAAQQLILTHVGKIEGQPVRFKRKDGSTGDFSLWGETINISGSQHLVSLIQDVTERRASEEALRASEERFSTVFRSSPIGISISRISDGTVLDVNPAMMNILGYTREETVGRKTSELGIWIDPTRREETIRALKESGQAVHLTAKFRRKDGQTRELSYFVTSIVVRGETCMVALAEDVTERHSAEEALRLSEERYRLLAENTSDTVWLMDMSLKILYISPSVIRQRGYSLEELNQLTLEQQMTPESLQRVQLLMAEVLSPEYLARRDATTARRIEIEFTRKDGTTYWTECAFTLILGPNGQPTRILGSAREISERKKAEEATNRQLRQFAALRNIDNAIRGSLDLRLTLSIILREAVTQLEVDAARILILHNQTKILEYAAGTGFRTQALQHAELRLGQGFAGQAALDQRTIHVPDLRVRKTDFLQLDNFAAEQFVTYCAVPLVTKGQVIGVMEVFSRTFTPLEKRMSDWEEFLQTIADQAAIAVENTHLFNTLQQTNLDLTRSVDEVLEAWAHALDVREKESPGHTRRVAEDAVRLAKLLGMGDADLLLLRRGALLHDIGKMVIPDSILLKDDPLSPEETKILHRHPVYAYEMLSVSSALRQVLDIPYCHHEKWDGSGFPRGLQGEHIPFSARIFSVVDAWNSMVYEKPGHPAMAREQALLQLQSQSETDFDPKIVAEFTQALKSEQPY